MSRPVPPLRVFLSYSHRDQELCDRFLVHLSQLKRDGLIEPWSDRRIAAGANWAGAIDDKLNAAHIVILLVSPDFLASDYCYDVEMTRALERHRSGEALVVPVILKPCDWETSRFAHLQALPRDGKPVVDWRTPEHGLVYATKGLRRSITELCGSAPVRAQVFRMVVRRHTGRLVGGLLFAFALLCWAWLSGQHYLEQGADLLNVGRYADARPALQRAKWFMPLSRAVGCGLQAVELDAMRSDLVVFEQRLNEANRQYPHCAYLKVLMGDQKYKQRDLGGAIAEYQKAVKREPRLAEAHFDIANILDQEGKPDEAFAEYKKAADLSGTPHYHCNLADLYFRRGDYDQAIELYGLIEKFPLAALEIAKIYRLQGKLDDAQGREEDAIRWLKDPSISNGEGQRAWQFDVSPDERKRLSLVDEKRCYADLELAVTRFLQGDESQAASAVPAVFRECSSRRGELRDIVKWELRRLGDETPDLAARCDAFTQRFLVFGH